MTSPDPDLNASPDPYEALDEIAEVVKDTRRFTIVSCALTILIIFAGGIGFAVWLSSTTNTANENSQQISTAKTVASVAKAAASQTKTTVVQIQQQGFENSEALRKLAECAQRSANVGDCIGQKQVPGTVRQGKEGRQGLPGRNATQAQVDAAVRKLCGASCKGPVGPAPSSAEVNAAVAAFCAANGGCKGPAGENTAVSEDQVAAAVRAYCDSRGGCRGEPGPAGDTVTGPQGPPGPAGANGADAPPPTQEQVNAGVAAFCAANPAACQAPVAPAPPATP